MPLTPRVKACYIASHRILLSLLACVPREGCCAGWRSGLGGHAAQGLSLASWGPGSSQIRHRSRRARHGTGGTRPSCRQMPTRPSSPCPRHSPRCTVFPRAARLPCAAETPPSLQGALHNPCLFLQPLVCLARVAFKMRRPALLLVYETDRRRLV